MRRSDKRRIRRPPILQRLPIAPPIFLAPRTRHTNPRRTRRTTRVVIKDFSRCRPVSMSVSVSRAGPHPAHLRDALRARAQRLGEHPRERAAAVQRRGRAPLLALRLPSRSLLCVSVRRRLCRRSRGGGSARRRRRGRERGRRGREERPAEAHDLVEHVLVPQVVAQPVGREDEDVVRAHGEGEEVDGGGEVGEVGGGRGTCSCWKMCDRVVRSCRIIGLWRRCCVWAS